jgi:hypothetical protein
MFNKSLQPYLQNKVIQKRSWLRTTSKVEAMPLQRMLEETMS